MSLDIMASEREQFEERAYSQRFIRSIEYVPGNPLGFRSDCPNLAEFVKRDLKGDYIDPTLDAMWWAWRAAKGLA